MTTVKQELRKAGMSEAVSNLICSRFSTQYIQRHLQFLPFRPGYSEGKSGGILRSALENNTAPPQEWYNHEEKERRESLRASAERWIEWLEAHKPEEYSRVAELATTGHYIFQSGRRGEAKKRIERALVVQLIMDKLEAGEVF